MANKIINQEYELRNMKTVPTEDSELKEKVKLLEAVVQKMFVNVIQLEAKINNKKISIKDNKIIEESTGVKVECKNKQEKTVREDGANQNPNYITQKVEANHINGKQSNDLECEMCDYSCKKLNIMKKHINMKHVDTKCKVCDKIFPNIKYALVHTANDHSQDIVDNNSEKNGSEGPDVQELHNYNKI